MEYILWATPIKKGKTEAARAYAESLETSHRQGYEESQRRLGIHREIFWIWPAKDGDDRDWMILYMEAENMYKAFEIWSDSDAEFDTHGKNAWADWCERLPEPLFASSAESEYVLEMLSYYQDPGYDYKGKLSFRPDPR